MIRKTMTAAALAAAVAGGCAPVPVKWGEQATMTPGWSRVGKAAADAFLSPLTLIPAAGAGVMQVGTWDRDVSTWASTKNPVFGSRDAAERWSDYLLWTSEGVYGLTAVSVPGGDTAGEWFTNKAQGVAVDLVAFWSASAIFEGLKDVTHRRRPDGSDTKSFPSGHATSAAALCTLSARHLEYTPLDPVSRRTADVSLGALAVATSWARVEAHRHYPSDVLAGMAIGHFVSSFVTDAFLGRASGFQAAVEPSRQGATVTASWAIP